MNKITNYFKTKPRISITTLLIIFIFLKYVIFPSNVLFIPLLAGSLSPELPYENTSIMFDNYADNIANIYSNAFERLYIAGQHLPKPTGSALRLLFAGVYWTTIVSSITLVLYLIRLIIYNLITKKEERKDGTNN